LVISPETFSGAGFLFFEILRRIACNFDQKKSPSLSTISAHAPVNHPSKLISESYGGNRLRTFCLMMFTPPVMIATAAINIFSEGGTRYLFTCLR
jgi:hypothetical protein